MNYRWFTYGTEGNIAKWSFMSEDQIMKIVSSLGQTNCYYTVQAYDDTGHRKRCPLFFDFDGPSSKEDALSLVSQIKEHFGAYPDIYDSGNKGYHVVLPISIIDNNCERVVKYIADNLFIMGPSWDNSIYSSRRMWRIPGTYNVNGGRNKTKLNKTKIFNRDELKQEIIKEWVEKAKQNIKENSSAYDDFIESKGNWKEHITPCIYRLITEPHEKGNRHNIIFFLARFFKYYHADVEEGIQVILNQEWAKGHDKHVRDTFRSCYNSAYPARFGCRNNLAEQFCVPELCFIKGRMK